MLELAELQLKDRERQRSMLLTLLSVVATSIRWTVLNKRIIVGGHWPLFPEAWFSAGMCMLGKGHVGSSGLWGAPRKWDTHSVHAGHSSGGHLQHLALAKGGAFSLWSSTWQAKGGANIIHKAAWPGECKAVIVLVTEHEDHPMRSWFECRQNGKEAADEALKNTARQVSQTDLFRREIVETYPVSE